MEPEPAMPAPAPETDPPARAPRRDRRGRPDWLPSRTALLVAAIAFGAGLLLFAALWLDQRNNNDFFKADGVPRSIEGQVFEPLPAPLPAGDEGRVAGGDSEDAGEARPDEPRQPPPPPAPVPPPAAPAP